MNPIKLFKQFFCKHTNIRYKYTENNTIGYCGKCGKEVEEDSCASYIPCKFWVYKYNQCMRDEWAVKVDCQGDQNSCEFPHQEQRVYAL